MKHILLLAAVSVMMVGDLLGQTPVTVSFSPGRNSSSFGVDSNISIFFSEVMSAESVNYDTFKVFGSLSGNHTVESGGTFPSVNSQTISFDPASNFIPGEVVTVILTTGITSAADVPIESALIYHFTIASGQVDGAYKGIDKLAVESQPTAIVAFPYDASPAIAVAHDEALTIYKKDLEDGFATVSTTDVGFGASAMYGADFDGNGSLDLVLANGASNYFSLLKSDGAGGFLAPQDYTVGNEPAFFTASDFDGDGDIDLAVANSLSNDISVLFNQGAGDFSAAVQIASGSMPAGIIAEDFDGDGDTDLACVNFDDENFAVFLNDGGGVFGAPVLFDVNGSPSALLGHDYDRDFDIDIAIVAKGTNSLIIFSNDGSGSFSASSTIQVGADPMALASFDADGDNLLDLAVANEGEDNVSVLLSPGNGNFLKSVDIVTGTAPKALIAGNFDNSGIPNVAVLSSQDNYISLLIKEAPKVVGVSPKPHTYNNSVDSNIEISFSQDIAVPLIDSPIKVYGSQTGLLSHDETGTFSETMGNKILFDPANNFFPGETITVVSTTGVKNASGFGLDKPHTFSFISSTEEGPGNFIGGATLSKGKTVYSANLADFNSDGNLDIASISRDSTLSISFNDGEGNFLQEKIIEIGTYSLQSSVGDFNNDGEIDIAILGFDAPAYLIVLINDGEGNFTQSYSGDEVDQRGGLIQAADFDGDGSIDLAISANGHFFIMRNTGQGDFVRIWDQPSAGLLRFSAGDIDGDGDVDLVTLRDFSGSPYMITTYLNNGSGAFSYGTTSNLNFNPGRSELVDLNGDNLLDVVTSTLFNKSGSLMFNNGEGSFESKEISADESGPGFFEASGVSFADFNGDGFLDVFACNRSDNYVDVFRNDGSGNFEAVSRIVVGNQPNGVLTGDLDNDGDLDMVVTHYSGNGALVFLNRSGISVTDFSPQAESKNSLANADISVSFSQDISTGTDLSSLIKVYGSATGLRTIETGGVFSGIGTDSVGFNPEQDFLPGEEVNVVITQNGKGTSGEFVKPAVYSYTSQAGVGSAHFFGNDTVKVGAKPNSILLKDFDGDGDLDMATLNIEAKSISIIENLGNRTYKVSEEVLLDIEYTRFTGGDFDGDGDLDIVAFSKSTFLKITNDGTGHFVVDQPHSRHPRVTPGVYANDFNMDGFIDFVTSADQGNVEVFLNDKNGEHSLSSLIPQNGGSSILDGSDFDRDGDIDVVSMRTASPLQVAYNNGLGSFPTTLEIEHPGQNCEVKSKDINGDLYPDIIVSGCYYDYDIYIFKNDQNGSFLSADTLKGGGYKLVELGDLDGDGDFDILASGSVYINDGLGKFSTGSSWAANGATDLAIGDLDGDLDLDVAVVNSSDSSVYLKYNSITQTIAFDSIPHELLYSPDPYLFKATSSSGLPVSFALDNGWTETAMISGDSLFLLRPGPVYIFAYQEGDSVYGPAEPVRQNIEIVRGEQEITFEEIPQKTYGDPPFKIPASSNRGLPLIFEHNGGEEFYPDQIRNDTLVIIGAGESSIRARQPGNEYYNEASATYDFVINKATASLTFSNLRQEVDGLPKSPIVTTDPIPLPVVLTYTESDDDPIDVGFYHVLATIDHANYQGSDTATFEIYDPNVKNVTSATEDRASQIKIFPNPFDNLIIVELPKTGDKNWRASLSIIDLAGNICYKRRLDLYKNELELRGIKPGVYLIKIETDTGTFIRRIIKR